MSFDLPEGAALLVAGHGTDARPLHTLGSIGEALLATPARWRTKRMSPDAGERYAPNRAALKRMLDDLAAQTTPVVLFACAGQITTGAGPALITGANPDRYPDEDALPLRWIADRLREAKAHQVVAVIAARAQGVASVADVASAWLDALRTDGDRDLIAVDAGGTAGLDALLSGLCGGALDPRTGTITLRSLGSHLVRSVPGIALQPSTASETVASPPPLGLLWDVRASVATHTMRARPNEAQPLGSDLTGVVLPGRFRVDEEIARGSFGIVYRARQLTVDRDVAVKIMHVGLDPASDDGRLFVQEIQAVGRIDHRNVVRIHQADVTPDGRLFFAMELLGGRDLRQLTAEAGNLPADRAVELTRQLLAGLGAAHEAGLVHADVKPANALVVNGKNPPLSDASGKPPRARGTDPLPKPERVVLVDFGLARLKPHEGAVESLGGTPAFMAPEQLRGERIDARADLFSAGLVLVNMMTGWRRASAEQLVPPLDGIADPALRGVLARALAVDPTERFQSAADFADALEGKTPRGDPTMVSRAPFHHLASFTENDQGRLHGRERDLSRLVEYALYRRAAIYTAPSGTGKTSLLRAGLVPRLGALGARAVYFSCRSGGAATLAAAISPRAGSIAEAIAAHHALKVGRLVLILDQVETALEAATDALLTDVLAFDRWPADADVSVILSVREDFLARLIAHRDQVDEGIPIVRLGPLTIDGAREAIALPLAQARLTIAPDLLDALLEDLERAAAVVGAELGWTGAPAVYPPHLQLACAALYDALGRGETTLTLAHYKRLGGLDAIVGEHLDRVLDRELDDADARVARDVFLALVTATQSRALRSELELLDAVGGKHGKDTVARVLEALRTRGLMVRVRATGGEPAWELVHDSLVPRILAWIDRRDLARRRAIELVRYHLRRSRPEAPSLLNRGELRELRDHAGAVDELEAEWADRTDERWTPRTLVARSRQMVQRRMITIIGSIVVGLSIAGIAIASWVAARARSQEEQTLKDRDIGRFALELAPFDWDPGTLTATEIPASTLPDLSWRLFELDPNDDNVPGPPTPAHLVRLVSTTTAATRIDRIEAHGGRAFLVVDGRGRAGERCEPSIVPLRNLPGYAQRDRTEPTIRIRIPSCHATAADLIDVPAGPFVYRGLGEPPSPTLAKPTSDPDVQAQQVERTVDLPGFAIDRDEVTNAAFKVFAAMAPITGIEMPTYPSMKEFADAGGPRFPVANISWSEAAAFCRYLGKLLPSNEEWTKALRGGITLVDGTPNPNPRRNLPWNTPVQPAPAKLADNSDPGPAPTGSWPGDRSPYGVLDLAGNVHEWTRTPSRTAPRFRISRGGNWGETTAANLIDFIALENVRSTDRRDFILGFRCVTPER